MKDVLVICEQLDSKLQKVTFELLGKGKELADAQNGKVLALLMGHNVSNHSQQLINSGADTVICVDDEYLKDYMTEPYTKAACAVFKEYTQDIVLVGASSIGRDLAPRIAARIKTGLTADCTTLEIDEENGNFLMTRPAFGGNIYATIICPEHKPQMATVRPGVMIAAEPAERQGVTVNFDVKFEASDKNVEILETVLEEKKSKDITEANFIVSGGRGMGSREGFAILSELADLFGGQVGASRAAVDSKYADKDRQVGQTGKTVRPDCYIACAISGAVQHVAGMEESELIIAINKNKFAPIFDIADLGIVGDVKRIVPKLTAKIKTLKA